MQELQVYVVIGGLGVDFMLTVCKKCDEVFQEDQGKCPCCGEPVPDPSPELKREEEILTADSNILAEDFRKRSRFTVPLAIIMIIVNAVALIALFVSLEVVWFWVFCIGTVADIILFKIIGRQRAALDECLRQLDAVKAQYTPSPEEYEKMVRAYIEKRKFSAESTNTPKVADPSYTVKCPTCGSPNCERVSATSRAVSAAAFGLYSNKRNKQFKCNNCNYEW